MSDNKQKPKYSSRKTTSSKITSAGIQKRPYNKSYRAPNQTAAKKTGKYSRTYNTSKKQQEGAITSDEIIKYPKESLHSVIKEICKGKNNFFKWHLLALLEINDNIQIFNLKINQNKVKESTKISELSSIFIQSPKEENDRSFRKRSISHVAKKEKTFKLTIQSEKSPLTFSPVKKDHSCRFSRVFGEDMFLSISYENFKGEMKKYFPEILDLSQPFELGKWQFLCSKIQDKKVIYIRIEKESKNGKLLNANLVRSWLVNEEINNKQALSKYNSRISLAFSTTVCLDFSLNVDQYEIIDDISNDNLGKDESVMTDGCGLISFHLMKKVSEKLQIPHIPSAIQGRFGSCKGVSRNLHCLFNLFILFMFSRFGFLLMMII